MPEIIVLYKTERKSHLIDIAVPGDKGTELKEQKKVENYSELRGKVKKDLEKVEIWIVPVVIEVLRVTSKRLED